MNTLFALMVGAFVYYLFFHPLNEREMVELTLDLIYLEYAEDNNGSDS
jgi:hypothetical protein